MSWNPTVSLVATARATETRDSKAVAVIEAIRTGRCREPIEYIRAEYAANGSEAISWLKKLLPGVLWSGVFSRRCGAELEAHPGLLVADLDDLGDQLPRVREQLLKSPYLFALFLSPSGTGLKAIFRVPADAALHTSSFHAVAAHVRDLCGVEVDPACKDVARLCFVSYDPEAFLNCDPLELPVSRLAAPVASPDVVSSENGAWNRNSLPPSVEKMILAGAPAGERHNQVLKISCQLRDSAFPFSEAREIICKFASRCTPPYSEIEALATLRSVYSTTPREPARITGSMRVKSGGFAHEYFPAEREELVLPAAVQWPQPMGADAFRGLAGDLVRAIDPHTEADPAALIVLFLAAFGNMAGAAAHFLA